jgi:hypothetical protein
MLRLLSWATAMMPAQYMMHLCQPWSEMHDYHVGNTVLELSTWNASGVAWPRAVVGCNYSGRATPLVLHWRLLHYMLRYGTA